MQYLLLIHSPEDAWESIGEDARKAMYEEHSAFSRDLREQGKFVDGNELQPTSAATSVRVRDGKTQVTDGPFAETKEALGGYYVIDAESLDEAIEWAARIPSARNGTIEVRPVVMREAPVS
jgi:hypothetical protein